MRLRHWFPAAATITALATAAALPAMTAAKPTGDGYVYQRAELKPLGNARGFVLQGTRTADGACHYDYPEVRLPSGVSAWEVRDVAIDPTHCKKIVEEGIPAEPDFTLADGDKRITEAIAESNAVTAVGGEAVTSTASGYNWTWWEDVLGIKVNQDRTNISWAYNGTCSGSGSASGEWSWAYGTGWRIVSYGGWEYESCSYYYYYYVRAYGYPSGSIGGTRSTDSVDECAPLWMHYQVRKVT